MHFPAAEALLGKKEASRPECEDFEKNNKKAVRQEPMPFNTETRRAVRIEPS